MKRLVCTLGKFDEINFRDGEYVQFSNAVTIDSKFFYFYDIKLLLKCG